MVDEFVANIKVKHTL